ncbi:7085_t:CDS:1 [Funneliformis geosporum]|uniref:13302_t:CDS:1 n=1 Tax=Funneliformis geosporum TaxID=1117311 RepID=A0A9W4SB16_9GLOM|nr:7085_t:CDS:1 [Funneliformis geosporum]CAI2162780.1 13302_t:CDS:1 [Funneliformis geosporum]
MSQEQDIQNSPINLDDEAVQTPPFNNNPQTVATYVSQEQDIQNVLINLDDEAVQTPPFNNDPQTVANYARIRRIQRITGRFLMERNIEREVTRILQSRNRYLTNLITQRTWRNCTTSRRQGFTTLARAANRINRTRLHPTVTTGFGDLMSLINNHQVTRTELESNLYNGGPFY